MLVKIKCIGECNDSTNKYLNPTTLTIVRNNNNSCPTKMWSDDKNLTLPKFVIIMKKVQSKSFKFYVCTIFKFTIRKDFSNIRCGRYRKIRIICKKNIMENSYYDTINRVLNAWNKVNFDMLKLNNDFLENIYLQIKKQYWKDIIEKDDIIKKKTLKNI